MNVSNGRSNGRRVAVTGVGVVSPNGVGLESYQDSLKEGGGGIDTIAALEAGSLSCQVAGEVKDIRPQDFLPAKELKRTGRAVHLAIPAVHEALQRAGLCVKRMSLEEKQSWGGIMGSGGGAADFLEEQF